MNTPNPPKFEKHWSSLINLTLLSWFADTSRPKKPNEQDGKGYYFIDPETMEAEIKKNMYIDHGEFGGHLYGTRISTIKEVIRSGKICVLDVSARVSVTFCERWSNKMFAVLVS